MGDDLQPAAPYLALADVADVLRVAPSVLVRLALRGAFAPVLEVTSRRRLVAVCELDAWERRVTVGVGPPTPRLSALVYRRALARRRQSVPALALDLMREEGSSEPQGPSSLR